MDDGALLARAARVVAEADGIVVAAGAGMGVDSGLPDFRGDEGFWNAYPPYRHLGLSFAALANPRWFDEDPALAWGFYGHRLNLYRATTPHRGFACLARLAARAPHGAFVFTSNVDGQFQRGGFDEARVLECHGSLMHLQCTRGTCGIASARGVTVTVDQRTFRADPPLPACPACGRLARPNVLMFGDDRWDSARTAAQEERFAAWLAGLRGQRLVVIECGAGTAVPTVRLTSERLARTRAATLVRINPREPQAPPGAISLALEAAAALARLEAAAA